MTTPQDTSPLWPLPAMRLGLTPREWFAPTKKSDPIADIRADLTRATRGLSVFGFAGPVPVDFTLASAARNRGETPR